MTTSETEIEVQPCQTIEEWERLWVEFTTKFPAFQIIAGFYHDGQRSDFYKLSCRGEVIDYSHASGLEIDARRSAEHATSKTEARCLRALAAVCDRYPRPEDDDE